MGLKGNDIAIMRMTITKARFEKVSIWIRSLSSLAFLIGGVGSGLYLTLDDQFLSPYAKAALLSSLGLGFIFRVISDLVLPSICKRVCSSIVEKIGFPFGDEKDEQH
jgi:hypothetical protein